MQRLKNIDEDPAEVEDLILGVASVQRIVNFLH